MRKAAISRGRVQVKAWARNHSINDGAQGSFNSYTLTTMVLYHLQAQPQPVVPPLVLLVPPDVLAVPRVQSPGVGTALGREVCT
jgi:DNA polymerase sigma